MSNIDRFLNTTHSFIDSETTVNEDGNVIENILQTVSINSDGIAVINSTGETFLGVAFTPTNFSYTINGNSATVPWGTFASRLGQIEAISQESNSTTININNTLQVQDGETIDNPTTSIALSSAGGLNQILLNRDPGQYGQIMVSTGAEGSVVWNTPNINGVLAGGNTAYDKSMTMQTSTTNSKLFLDPNNVNLSGDYTGSDPYFNTNINSDNLTITKKYDSVTNGGSGFIGYNGIYVELGTTLDMTQDPPLTSDLHLTTAGNMVLSMNGTTGDPGQILVSDGAYASWGSPTINQIVTNGNRINNQSLIIQREEDPSINTELTSQSIVSTGSGNLIIVEDTISGISGYLTSTSSSATHYQYSDGNTYFSTMDIQYQPSQYAVTINRATIDSEPQTGSSNYNLVTYDSISLQSPNIQIKAKDSTGNTGDFLGADGLGYVEWFSVNLSPTINDVLTNGNISTDHGLVFDATGTTLTNTLTNGYSRLDDKSKLSACISNEMIASNNYINVTNETDPLNIISLARLETGYDGFKFYDYVNNKSSSIISDPTYGLHLNTSGSNNDMLLDSTGFIHLESANTIQLATGSSFVSVINNSGVNDINIYTGTNALQINGLKGTANQVITSDSTGMPTWTDPTFVASANATLDMKQHDITNCTSLVNSSDTLTVGSSGQSTTLPGNVNISNKLSYGDTGQYLFYGGNGGNSITTSKNLQTDVGIAKPVNLEYVCSLQGSTPAQTVTLFNAKEGNFMYVVNSATVPWTIATNGTDIMTGGLAGASSTSIAIAPNKTISFIQTIVSGVGVYVYVSETVTNSALSLNYGSSAGPVPINIAGGTEYTARSASATLPALSTLNKNSVTLVTGGSSGIVLTLPTVTATGYYLTFYNANTNGITLQSASTNILATGVAPATSYTIATKRGCTFYTVNGVGWIQTSMV